MMSNWLEQREKFYVSWPSLGQKQLEVALLNEHFFGTSPEASELAYLIGSSPSREKGW